MLELYYFPDATCGIKARLAFFEKEVRFTPRVLDRYQLSSPEYLALNPKAVVPTLVHDGNVLVESTVICLYVDDAFDGPALKPSTALDRARMYLWLKSIDEVYFKGIGSTTFGLYIRHQIQERYPTEEALEAYYATIKVDEYRRRRRSIVSHGLAAPEVKQGLNVLNDMIGRMEADLEQDDHLAGPDYSLADACATPFVMRLAALGLSAMWDQRPRVGDWWERIQARDSYRRLLEESFPPSYFENMKSRVGDVWPQVQPLLSS